MKIMPRAIQLPVIALVFCVASCATVSKVGKGSVAFVQKTTAATTSKVTQLSTMAIDRIRPPQVQVVEVREKDLKKIPTGHERALAYENTRKRSFWFFNGPVDFKEPSLPESGGEMDGSLLPPRTP
jgi:hypothetical protein